MSIGSGQSYALQEFRQRVEAEDWRFDYPWAHVPITDFTNNPEANVRKAYILSLLAELAYEFVPKAELERSGRLKLVPCERFRHTLRTRNAIAVDVWRSLNDMPDMRVEVFEGEFFQTIAFRTALVLFVVFRGTRFFYMGDWRVNLNAQLVTIGTDHPCSYHRGFAVEAIKLADRLIGSLRPALDNQVPIYLAGHSLGGALAGAMFELYRSDERRSSGLPYERELRFNSAYTFASPRYGSMAVVGWAPPPPCHFRDAGDPVPFIPPIWMGYSDPRVEFNLAGKPLAKRLDSRTTDYVRTDRPTRFGWRTFRPHSITHIRKSLARVVGANPDLDLIPTESPERERALQSMY